MATVLIQIGIAIGGQLLSSLFAPKPPDAEGPRLNDLSVPALSPGNPIPRAWGRIPVPGQVIWTTGLKETRHSKKVKGGKGGSKSQTVVTYTYSSDVGVAFHLGEISRVVRIEADKKPVWVNAQAFDDIGAEAQAIYNETYAEVFASLASNPGLSPVQKAKTADEAGKAARDQFLGAVGQNDTNFSAIEIYLGTDTQNPSPIMESVKGVGNVPAYRGIAYFVIDELQLADYGNRIPQFTVEMESKDGARSRVDIVVGDVCRESGLSPEEYDVENFLRRDEIRGFAATRPTSGRELIDLIRAVYPFDIVESGFKLKFVDRERKAQAIINRNDLSARTSGSPPITREEIIRAQELELPRSLQFSYLDDNRDYSGNSVRAKREVTASNEDRSIDLPMVMTSQEAKTAVERSLGFLYADRRTFKYTLPPKYAILEPGDTVVIKETNSDDFRYMRITQVDLGANWIVDMTLTDLIYETPDLVSIADPAITDRRTILPFGDTEAVLMDIPLLNDDDSPTAAGFYVALHGPSDGWPGGTLYRDAGVGGSIEVFDQVFENDTGTAFELIVTNTEKANKAVLMNNMTVTSPFVIDRTNRVVVLMVTKGASLSSIPEGDLYLGRSNVAYINGELIQFATANNLGNGVFELRNILRGVNATEYAIAAHPEDSEIFFLSDQAVERFTHSVSLLDEDVVYKSATFDQDIAVTDPFIFVSEGNSLRPLSPVNLVASRNDDGDIILTWNRRARQNNQLKDGVDVPLDFDQESYEIEVLDGPGGAVVREATVANLTEWTYSAADQVTDFGSEQSSVTFVVYQIGDIVHRGFPASATL